MRVGDLVRRKVSLPGLAEICGIVINVWSDGDLACEVMWPGGGVTMPFMKNLEVVSESR
jgi:hypothetical protein